jgi:hypothetical protein
MTHLSHIGKGTRIPPWQYHSSSGTMLCTDPTDNSNAADTLTHQFSKISSPTHATFTSPLQYNHHHRCPRGYFETHCAVFFMKPSLHTSSNGGEFWWVKCVLLINQVTLQTSSPDHNSSLIGTAYQLIPWAASKYLTCVICFCYLHKYNLLPNKHKCYRLGSLVHWICHAKYANASGWHSPPPLLFWPSSKIVKTFNL